MSIDLITEAEEAALAMAQAVVYVAIERSGLDYGQVSSACGMSAMDIRHLLQGNADLTVKQMARLLAACGREPRFESVPYASGRVRT